MTNRRHRQLACSVGSSDSPLVLNSKEFKIESETNKEEPAEELSETPPRYRDNHCDYWKRTSTRPKSLVVLDETSIGGVK
jgi:hypothetical protein